MTDLARPLPVLVMSTLLGIPPQDRADVMERSIDVSKAFAVFIPEQERAAAHEAVVWLRAYFRTLLPTALEEFLRWDAPIHTTTRLTLEPVEVGGRTLRRGRVVVLLLASANHDERQFADPGGLDVGRRPNAHLSFGGGVHHCLGAMLARVEATAVFDRLLDRFTALEPAGEEDWQPSGGGFRFPYCAYRSLPVRIC
ncbi:cytochrome P450 [Streptomyces albiflavescens]|uniref:cytochrome P450 n=1 Tax=Streptomyces albiflavescens TaxID=1623582 RepID=UPI001E351E6F|nr:cytochrome P450 [Streptomyces albiflavescens]